jgi:aspartate carbamoyltransferase catalytic subunit
VTPQGVKLREVMPVVEPSTQGTLPALRHLLTLRDLDADTIVALLDKAESYLRPAGELPARDAVLEGRTVANLFFEPSTRTRASFELAAKRMSADVLNLDVNMSSRIKGESVLDTIYTLQAMQTDIFVVRDASEGIPALIADHVQPHVGVLNAGEASISHPTQGLLDLLTIRRHKGDFSSLVISVIGDIGHSRVARSLADGLEKTGVGELRLTAPPGLAPEADDYPNAAVIVDIDEAISGADVVMALRIQRERIKEQSSLMTSVEYLRNYGLTQDRLNLAKPDAIVMHPGPMNRDVEIASGVADGPQSVIEEQVTSGLAVRMAVLAAVVQDGSKS